MEVAGPDFGIAAFIIAFKIRSTKNGDTDALVPSRQIITS
jgi:hypothetical protein